MSTRAIPELSIDTQTLERLLLTIPVGDMVSYATLSDAISRNVQNGAAHILSSARKRLLRQHQVVFEAVWGKGLKRLDDVSIALSGDGTLQRIHNLGRRATQKLACVQDFDKLPNDAKLRHNVSVSIFGTLAEVTKTKTIKRLEAKMSNGQHDALPVAKFLDAMKASL